MFEPAGRVSATPAGPEQRSVPEAKRRADEFGSPFFWVLFFGDAKKSPSPGRAKPCDITSRRLPERHHRLIPQRPQHRQLLLPELQLPRLPLVRIDQAEGRALEHQG